MELEVLTVLVAIVLIRNLPVSKSNPIASWCGVEFHDSYAIVTCNFSVNVYAEKRKFSLEYKKDDAPRNDAPGLMIACFWNDSILKYKCVGDNGYELYSYNFSNVLKFKVKRSDAESGNFTCVTGNQQGASCRGCQTTATTSTTTKSSDVANTDGTMDHTLVVVIVPCVTALIIVVIVVMFKCYRLQKLQRAHDIQRAGREPTISADDGFNSRNEVVLPNENSRSNSPEPVNVNNEKEEEIEPTESEDTQPLLNDLGPQSSICEVAASDPKLQASTESHSTIGAHPVHENEEEEEEEKEKEKEEEEKEKEEKEKEEKEKEKEEEEDGKEGKRTSTESKDNEKDTKPSVARLIKSYENKAADRNLQASSESHSTKGESKQAGSRKLSDLADRKSAVGEAQTVDKKNEQGPAKVLKRQVSSPGEPIE